ncbi:hypothetical protein SAMN04489844_0972 [Nocardioides exalbidus]|uniref:PASTA domain-containing protein n=1 Tax=Nocardioides exalbidus TaxID=402596 RepID=A0A1H4LUQ8_9ACTN|nr:hypothetical protein [Nocardioides exalbidus]SEB74560.1 hypothetical protein SAMN04489844_0972 [Nocardioides exalbidus]
MRRIALRRAAGAVILVAVAGLVTACGGDDASEKAGEKLGEKLAEQAMEDSGGGDVDVDVDGEDVTIESEEGTIAVGSGEVPDSFPSELSIPDGEVVSSVDTPQGSLVTLDVEDPAGAFDEAVADLEANGWTRVMVTEAEGTKMAQYSKGDASATVLSDDASGQLTYTIGTA